MSDKKTVREELAELTEAVRDLREDEVAAELRRLRAEVEQLRAQRGAHHCTGCTCTHVHWYYQPTYPAVPGCAGGALPLTYITTNGVNISTITAAAAPQPVYGYSMQMGSATEPAKVLSGGYSVSASN